MLKHYLLNGFSYGFSIRCAGVRKSRIARNLQSALEQPMVMSVKLEKEWSAGRIVGPFAVPPFDIFLLSPLGVIPKKTPGEFRIIIHLSYPEGSSVNDFIPDDQSSISYASISGAISLIKTIGSGCFMAKTDIELSLYILLTIISWA